MEILEIRPIRPDEIDRFCQAIPEHDPKRFVRMPPRLTLEGAAESGMAVGGFRGSDDALVCGGVTYEREAEGILRCREFGSVFAHLQRYGLMKVLGSLFITLHKLLDREGLPLISVAANDNFESRKQLARLHFADAPPELVESLSDARPLLAETQMFVFDEVWLDRIRAELAAIYPEGTLRRSIEPHTLLGVRFHIPLLPADLLCAACPSLGPKPGNVVDFPGGRTQRAK